MKHLTYTRKPHRPSQDEAIKWTRCKDNLWIATLVNGEHVIRKDSHMGSMPWKGWTKSYITDAELEALLMEIL